MVKIFILSLFLFSVFYEYGFFQHVYLKKSADMTSQGASDKTNYPIRFIKIDIISPESRNILCLFFPLIFLLVFNVCQRLD